MIQNYIKNISDRNALISRLTEKSNKIFESLKRRDFISKKQLKYLRFDFKKAYNFGKLYLLPKIHKRIFNVPGTPVISSCGTPTEKVSQFLDSQLQTIMRKVAFYIKDSGDFICKIKRIGSVPENSILVIANVVGLYPSILHDVGLKALKQVFDKWEQRKK